MEWVTVGTFAVGALLKAPELIRRVEEVGRSDRDLRKLISDGDECLNNLQVIKSRMNKLSEPSSGRRSKDQETLDELCHETKKLIRYCRRTVKDLMTYYENYRNSFSVRLLHWLAIAKRSRTELHKRRLKECELWIDIAALTTFLHFHYNTALEIARRPDSDHTGNVHGSDFLMLCQYHAHQLRKYMAEATTYCHDFPGRMEKHMGEEVNLNIFRRYWNICNERFLQPPRASLSSTYGFSVGTGTPSPGPDHNDRASGGAAVWPEYHGRYRGAQPLGDYGMPNHYEERQPTYLDAPAQVVQPPRPEVWQQPEPRPFAPPIDRVESRQHHLPTQAIPNYGYTSHQATYRAEQSRQEHAQYQSSTPLCPRAPSPRRRSAPSPSSRSRHVSHHGDSSHYQAGEHRPFSREHSHHRRPPPHDDGYNNLRASTNYPSASIRHPSSQSQSRSRSRSRSRSHSTVDRENHNGSINDHSSYDYSRERRHREHNASRDSARLSSDNYNNNHREYSQYSQPRVANNLHYYHHHHDEQDQPEPRERPRRSHSSSSTASRSSHSRSTFDYHTSTLPTPPSSVASSITTPSSLRDRHRYTRDVDDEYEPPERRSSSSRHSDNRHEPPPPTQRGHSSNGNNRQGRPPPSTTRDSQYPPISAENNTRGRRKLQKMQRKSSRSSSERSLSTRGQHEPRRSSHGSRGW